MWVSHPNCHVEPAETSSRKAHFFRYARFFDYAQNDKENFEFYQLFQIGCGCPTQSSHQADNLAKLWQEFLSVTRLIAKIFGAVSRTISLMRLSALLASKRCRCRNDGFCSDEEQERATLTATLMYT